MEGKRPPWRAPLGIPRFRALWIGGLLSWYGDFLTLPALVIIAYRLGAEEGVGLLFVFTTAPLLLLLPFGGQLGDQGDRRRRLVSLDTVRAALAALVIVGTQGHVLGIVLVAAGASRSAGALYEPGRRRLVSVLLPDRLIPAGSSLLSVVSESAILVAPALGALLLLVGLTPSMLIALDGATFLTSAVLLLRVGPQPALWGARAYSPPPIWASLRRGFRILMLESTTRLFVVQATLGAALASVVQVYFVPLARYAFHLGTDQVGIMYVVVGGASVLGSAVALRVPQVGRRSVIVVGYIKLLIVALVGAALGAWVVVLALVVFAASGALQEVWGFNRIQMRTQREGVGQAMGSALWCLFLGRALGAAVATWGATHLDRADFLLILAVVTVIVCLAVSASGLLAWRRNPAAWPPGGPPLTF